MKRPSFSPAPNADNVVTASDLVRHFGLWQDRAGRAPVYILHRGRPRHVLTSIETMQALCAPHERDEGEHPAAGDLALLGITDDLLVIVDRDLDIVAASHRARRYFGDAVRPGQSVDALSAGGRSNHLRAATARVMATGHDETIDIPAPYAARVLACSISPFPGADGPGGGAALALRDVTLTDELADERSWARACGEAAAATAMCATARLNLRGYLEAPDAAVANFLGGDVRMLGSVRFITLIDVGTRVAVGTAFEQVISTGEPISVDAQILLGGADPRAVRIGLAPVRSGATIVAVAALLVETPLPGQVFRQA